MSNLLNESPLFYPELGFGTEATTDKGRQIMEGLLLDQYQNSPDLQEFIMAFVSELDLLFEQIQKVYSGRFIENAVGRQLDIIGIILQQSRSLVLPNTWFGFSDDGVVPLNVDGMVDEAGPVGGGLFKDENSQGVVTPLEDATYRKVLLAKAMILNRDSADINLTYFVVSILVGKSPSVFELRDQDSTIPTANRSVELIVSSDEITSKDEVLIYYMTKYFVPAGITFTINRI